MARASIETIRTRLLKLAAHVKVTVRRVWLEFPEVFPRRDVFRAALQKSQAAATSVCGRIAWGDLTGRPVLRSSGCCGETGPEGEV